MDRQPCCNTLIWWIFLYSFQKIAVCIHLKLSIQNCSGIYLRLARYACIRKDIEGILCRVLFLPVRDIQSQTVGSIGSDTPPCVANPAEELHKSEVLSMHERCWNRVSRCSGWCLSCFTKWKVKQIRVLRIYCLIYFFNVAICIVYIQLQGLLFKLLQICCECSQDDKPDKCLNRFLQV